MTDLPISYADVESAAERVRGVAHRTPVASARTLDERAGAEVMLKCENLQRMGAFKFRGAYNAISRLSPDQLARGVAAHSSGNHAQAVALACRTVGAPALVVIPADASPAKAAAVRDYGAEVVTYDRGSEDRVAICAALAAERGMAVIPPFDHPHVMAGQGTAVLELLHDGGRCDTVVVPVGGGGLIAGSSVAAKGGQPDIQVIGVEPEAADDTRRSLAAGRRIQIEPPNTIADGLRSEIPGELTFAVNSRLVDEVVVVSEDEIRAAMLFAFERMKLVVEPSGAVGLAAVLSGRISGRRIGVIISGGNVDAADFADLIGMSQRDRAS
jgi:threonine dehydratase